MITARLPLAAAQDAVDALADRQGIRTVLTP
jgi:hypothetical protein